METLELEPAGFPNCQECPFRDTGPVRVCVECASKSLAPIPDDHCQICSQALRPGGRCVNALCNETRHIARIRAIAQYSGDLANVIRRLKYQRKTGWTYIFGRLVTGYLEARFDPEDFDLILPNPTFGIPSGDSHTEGVLRRALEEDILDRWQFMPDGVLIKTGPTPRSAGRSMADKQAAARALRDVLVVPVPSLIEGQDILIYDDVCTTGSQLNVVAECLLDHGAASVEGLVLARTPWAGG